MMDGFSFGVGVIVGMFWAALLIWVLSWFEGRRLRRLDRQNVEAMAKIKERMFNEPFPFGIPITESDLVPDDKIYVVNPDYPYLDGKPAGPSDFVMSPKTKARIKNIGES